MIPLPGKWWQRKRSYESLTFTFTLKLTQPVSCTVAWQATGDDDGFSSYLKSFFEFPMRGWSFHLYARPEWVTGWNVMLLLLYGVDVFNEGFVHLPSSVRRHFNVKLYLIRLYPRHQFGETFVVLDFRASHVRLYWWEWKLVRLRVVTFIYPVTNSRI